MIILINETQIDFKTEKSQIIRLCSTLETSQKSNIANQRHVVVDQCHDIRNVTTQSLHMRAQIAKEMTQKLNRAL
jgi:hypothetical protein